MFVVFACLSLFVRLCPRLCLCPCSVVACRSSVLQSSGPVPGPWSSEFSVLGLPCSVLGLGSSVLGPRFSVLVLGFPKSRRRTRGQTGKQNETTETLWNRRRRGLKGVGAATTKKQRNKDTKRRQRRQRRNKEETKTHKEETTSHKEMQRRNKTETKKTQENEKTKEDHRRHKGA